MYIGIEIVCLCLLSALAAMCLSASWGGVFIAWVNELSARRKKNIFRDKYAQQITRLSLYSILLGSIIVAGMLPLTIRVVQQLDRLIWQFSWKASLYPGIFLLFGFFLLLFYFFLWKKLRKKKAFHLSIGFLSMISIWIGGYWLFNLKMGLIFGSYPEHIPGSEVWKISWLPVKEIEWWIFLGHLLLLAIGSSGLLGLIFLLLRRKKDDFGRDYYRYAIPLSAKWSLPFSLQVIPMILLLFLCFTPVQGSIVELTLIISTIISILCFLLPVWLLVNVFRNEAPLRLKGTIILSIILSWIALAGCSFLYLGIFEAELVQKAFS